jgi:Fic family protein
MALIADITKLKEELDTFQSNRERDNAIQQKLRLEWNYHSNHMEGNTLTFSETKTLIMLGVNILGKQPREIMEMKGHNEALKWIYLLAKMDYKLSEEFIRELHKLILVEQYEMTTLGRDGFPSRRTVRVGHYKSYQNFVRNSKGEVTMFSTPKETPLKMAELCTWYNDLEQKKDRHPLLLATELHYRYINIHPFDDGNGRIARIIMNFSLMKQGFPPIIIKTNEKKKYIAALNQADRGDIKHLVRFIGNNLIEIITRMINMYKGIEPIA